MSEIPPLLKQNSVRALVLLAVLTSVCLGHAAAGPRAVFVSPDGDDTASGTSEQPLRTAHSAQAKIRELLVGASETAFFVYFKNGTHVLEKPLQFGPADSAPPGVTVHYLAAPGEKPLISGGTRLQGWQQHEKGLWKTKSGDLRFRQLYVNGEPATRARTPNGHQFFRLDEADLPKRSITVPAEFMERWKNPGGVEMHVTLIWAEAILRIKDFSPDPTSPDLARVTFREPESELVFRRDWPRFLPNQAFHLENAYEFLDTPGEWFLDEKNDEVYYLPREGEDMTTAEVIAPRLETLVVIRGEPARPVRGLRFSGLTFSHSNWTKPSDQGHLHTQAGQYAVKPTVANDQYVGRMPSAFHAEWAGDLSVERNFFTNLGTGAVDFQVGVRESAITGNVFYQAGGAGITLGIFSPEQTEIHVPWQPDNPAETVADIRVANNYIRRIGTAYPGSCGIAAGYVSGLVVEHNEILDLPYTGISLGWGWTSKPSALRDNIVRHNHVHDVMRDLTDGGGIYTLSLQPGTRILRNHVHRVRSSPKANRTEGEHATGIYFDEATGGTADEPFVVTENFVHDCSQGYKFHVTGTILMGPKLDYADPPAYMTQVRPGSEIAALAGLQPAFQNLRTSLPFREIVPFTEYREILTRAQMERRGLTGQSRQVVMTADLRNDPETISEYDRLHSAGGIWPEVVGAAEISGIDKIKIHRFDNRLFMVIDLPKDAKPEEVFSVYDNSNPRVKEWAARMKQLQTNLPGQDPGTTWMPMQTIHDYEYGTVK